MTTASHVTSALLFCLLQCLFFPLHTESATVPSNPTTAPPVAMPQLSPAQCQLAKTQCPTLGGGASNLDLDPELLLLRLQYEDSLKRLKRYFNSILDTLMENPTASPAVTLCANLGEYVTTTASNATTPRPITAESTATTKTTPTPATPTTTLTTRTQPSTTQSSPPPTTEGPTTTTTTTTTPLPTTSTTLAAVCTVSSWSEWSLPFGFGVQTRHRTITTPGYSCPEEDNLKEIRRIVYNETGTDTPFVNENYTLVGMNFENDFIRNAMGPRDILIIVDASGSISQESLTAIKEGIKMMIDLFCGGFGDQPSNNRLALLEFSRDATGLHAFNRDQSPSTLKLVVDSLFPMYGYTCTEKAFSLAEVLFQKNYGARDNVAHDTLLITDGHSNCNGDVRGASLSLQKFSNIFALGINVAQDSHAQREIESLVSNEDPRHLFSLANFQDFESMIRSISERSDDQDCLDLVVHSVGGSP